jgi:hypothetical protein
MRMWEEWGMGETILFPSLGQGRSRSLPSGIIWRPNRHPTARPPFTWRGHFWFENVCILVLDVLVSLLCPYRILLPPRSCHSHSGSTPSAPRISRTEQDDSAPCPGQCRQHFGAKVSRTFSGTAKPVLMGLMLRCYCKVGNVERWPRH